PSETSFITLTSVLTGGACSALVRKFVQRGAQLPFVAVAQNGDRHMRARAGAGDDVAQTITVLDLGSVDDGDHVALLHACALGRASLLDMGDVHAANFLESEIRGHVRSDWLNAHAQIAALDLAGFYQLFGDAARHIRRDREADADVAPGRRDDLR